jgi:hypothetical protein
MKSLSACLFLILLSNSYAEEATSPNDRYLDSKTGKLVRICEMKNGEPVVKEVCGKHWDVLPRKRSEISKEIPAYKDVKVGDLILFPLKQYDGSVKLAFGEISYLYENGMMHVFQSESQRTGFTKGATSYDFDYRHAIKLDPKNPLLAHGSMCAKEDTVIPYSYNENHEYKVKKGEKVVLKGVFENNQTALISFNNTWYSIWGYGHNNQLEIDLSKLEVCEDDKAALSVVNDTSRGNTKDTIQNQDNVNSTPKRSSSISQ